ncbi:MAG: Uma2 family endonuclease [Chloroflexota bacterium]
MINRGELCTDQPFELVDGELVWLSLSRPRESETSGVLFATIFPFARAIGAHMLDSSGAFMVGARLQQLRGPDVSLVVEEWAHFIDPDGWFRGAPDLAVEVLSPGEYGEAYARTKVPEYLAAGAKVVWLVDPRRRTIREYLPGRSEFLTYSAEHTITLDAVAPGFSAVLCSLFPAS